MITDTMKKYLSDAELERAEEIYARIAEIRAELKRTTGNNADPDVVRLKREWIALQEEHGWITERIPAIYEKRGRA